MTSPQHYKTTSELPNCSGAGLARIVVHLEERSKIVVIFSANSLIEPTMPRAYDAAFRRKNTMPCKLDPYQTLGSVSNEGSLVSLLAIERSRIIVYFVSRQEIRGRAYR